MNIAVILAGGVGSRVGYQTPKQFISILGKPVLVYTLEKFQNNPNIDFIEIVCLASYISVVEKYKQHYNLPKIKWIVSGGVSFSDSVYKGIMGLDGKVSPNDIVVVHFGASPFVEDDIIDDCIEVCKKKGNAISASPFFYLSAFKDPDNPTLVAGKWVSRDSLICMNSPHAFKYGYIFNIYKKAIESGIIQLVEPHTTTIMQFLGEKIFLSKGSQTNIKITTREDLELFEGYVLKKQKDNKDL